MIRRIMTGIMRVFPRGIQSDLYTDCYLREITASLESSLNNKTKKLTLTFSLAFSISYFHTATFVGGGPWGRHVPNMFEIAKKLVKIRPCCKRVGCSIFRHLFCNNNWSIGQNAPPPQRKVFQHNPVFMARKRVDQKQTPF